MKPKSDGLQDALRVKPLFLTRRKQILLYEGLLYREICEEPRFFFFSEQLRGDAQFGVGLG